VRISVLDAAGREIAVLVDTALKAGEFETRWNGRDKDGKEAGSGIYFARMTAGACTAETKMILLR
jgi:flagellar hook assembly protein FlgD